MSFGSSTVTVYEKLFVGLSKYALLTRMCNTVIEMNIPNYYLVITVQMTQT